MTALNKRKTRLEFETGGFVRGRPVIVEATPRMARLHLKGERGHVLEMRWEEMYWRAAKKAADFAFASKHGNGSKKAVSVTGRGIHA